MMEMAEMAETVETGRNNVKLWDGCGRDHTHRIASLTLNGYTPSMQQ